MSNLSTDILPVARELGLSADDIVPFGRDKAKVRLEALRDERKQGRLILVSAMTPTAAGEGKTTVAIGLADGLRRIGQRACVALRQPSLGPTFGMKGGATGGGLASLQPAHDINLHFTGDFHAVGAAHNLLAALADNTLYHDAEVTSGEKRLSPQRVWWRRVLDMSDRALRNVVIGLGGPQDGVPRSSGFDITPASEVMAVLCLARDLEDLRQRLGRMIVGLTRDEQPVTAADLRAVGAMMTLLKDALLPNLVQSLEGTPAFVHGGPFANIAHGCSSVVATRTALAHADWAVTEAGFGFDLGGEKFFDLKCRAADLRVAGVVLVATIRALRAHGGVARAALEIPDRSAVARGLANLMKHVENVRMFGKTPIVGINLHPSDTSEEIDFTLAALRDARVAATTCDVFARGGVGGAALAELVVAHAESSPQPAAMIYGAEDSFKEKLRKVARTLYGAADVSFTKAAEQDVARLEKLGLGHLPPCVAKTPNSFTEDASAVGCPSGFTLTVRNVLAAAGAGYLVPLIGDMLRMPGLPSRPRAWDIDLSPDGPTGL